MRSFARRSGTFAVASTLLLTLASIPITSAADPVSQRVSIDSGSVGPRELPAVSDDGTHVVFAARGVASQGIWMRFNNQTYRITSGNDTNPAISGDGNVVAFTRVGTTRSVFKVDVTNPAVPGTPVQVDVANGAGGVAANGPSDNAALDTDGSVIAFQSDATNLVTTPTLPTSGGATKVYVRDGVVTEMVSVTATDPGTALPGSATKPDLSGDGNIVVFASEQQLVAPPAGVTNTSQQVYVRNRTAHTTVCASVVNGASLVPGNAGSALGHGPTVSTDGNVVAFESDASNLVAYDSNGATDAFVRNITGTTTTRVSERTPFAQTGPFAPVTAVRLMDTRLVNDPFSAGTTRVMRITGLNDVPVGAAAVALNVTVVNPTENGFVTVYRAGAAVPTTSSITVRKGVTAGNAVTAELSADGSIAIHNENGRSDIVVDLVGYYSSAAVNLNDVLQGFTPMVPVRALDTRLVVGGALDADKALTLKVAGVGDVPATASSVMLKLFAVQPTRDGFLTAYPTGGTRPTVSSLNFTAGETIGNTVIVPVGTGGSINIYNANGTTQVVVDVAGYWEKDAANGGLTAIVPVRAYDSRNVSAMTAGSTIDVTVLKVGEVPADGVAAVAVNVTSVNPTADGYLTVFPTGRAKPLAAGLTTKTGIVRSSQVVVPVGANGKISIFNANGSGHVVIDILGWWSGVQVSSGGTGPAITGDGLAVAFESTDLLTSLDTNGAEDAFMRVLGETPTTSRLSVAVVHGTEGTGTRTDSITGLVVAQVNGSDIAVGATRNAVAYVSNGDLANDKPQTTPGVPNSEMAVYALPLPT
ncbi:MAG: hypothetical protein RLZ14_31 [Actinomycetota bacterium]